MNAANVAASIGRLPVASPFTQTLARRVRLAESVPPVGHGERPVTPHRRLQPVALALVGIFEVGNHVGRRVVLAIEQREMPLPDAFDARRGRESLVMNASGPLCAGRRTA